MIRPRRWLAVGLALSLWLGGIGGAEGRSDLVSRRHMVPSDAALLARHAPVIVLHPDERFAPVAVAGFLADADLVGGRYDVRACAAKDGLAALDCYDEADEPSPATAHGAVFRSGGRTALQYWLFYPFNLWSPTVPQSADFWQSHEGDWEAVTVLLDERLRPQTVGVSRHCGGARRSWARAPKQGLRPVVHVALGSHANYFAAGTRKLEARCWPKEAVAIYAAYKVPMLDHAAAGQTVRPRVIRVTATTPAWIRFAGRWGEDQYARFPGNTFRFGAGPLGPVQHDLWRRPLAVPAGWPAD